MMIHPPLSVGLEAIASGLSTSGVPTAFERSRGVATALVLRMAANVVEHGADLAAAESRVLSALIHAGTARDDGGENAEDRNDLGLGETDVAALRRRLVDVLGKIPTEKCDDFLLHVAHALGDHAHEQERSLLGA